MRFFYGVLLLSLAFPCLVQARSSKRNMVRGEVNNIVLGIKSFYNDHGRMPVDGETADSREVIRVLIGEDRTANPRETIYLELDSSNTDGTFLDLWGQQYAVYLDHDYDGKITIYGEEFRTVAIAQSAGPDGRLGTRDDVFSARPSYKNLAPDLNSTRLGSLAERWWRLVVLIGFLAAIAFAVWKQKYAWFILLLLILVMLLFIFLPVPAELL